MTDYRIRGFNPDTDIESVQNINRKCLPENYPRFFFTDIYDKFPEGFNVAQIEENGEIAGYGMTRLEKGLSNFGFGICKKGHIISIAVLPSYRRMGIAIKLMAAASDAMRIRDVKEVYLEVRESNQAAINLYQNLGYIPHKISKRYYSDGESALIMISKI
ncbi:MAG: GNAT family N-acetyltransferase [Candidatus Heimdallarchaeota archaeon]|nr:GNAT family N-acetyltransferase [Candidatus Heimdallarchaeota archaeon]MBY8993344.1 GNAT family N-acetyltransferase [Candidatus Heimdallarchaeota archaeon]